jgi:hypothetical protein
MVQHCKRLTTAAGIGCLLLLGSALSSCNGRGVTYSGRPGPAAWPGARQLPSLGLGVHDHIESVDFAVEGDSVLHLVWRVRFGDDVSFLANRQVWYRRGDLKNKLWGNPHLFLSGRTGEPRIVSLGSSLHVIVSDNLRHFISRDGGATWEEESPLLPQHIGIAQSIDVVSDSASLYAAYAASDSARDSLVSQPPRSVWVTRWTEGEKTSTAWIQSIGEKTPWATPKLRFGDDGMYLFYTANELKRFTRTTAEVTGWLFHVSSRDRGISWTNPDSSGYPGGIFEFEAAIAGNERSMFREGQGLCCARWQGGAWSSSDWVAQPKTAPLSNYQRVSSINAATRGDEGQLVWIDTRYQRTDQTLLNPLTWIPWVSNPGWENNDVLAAPFSKVTRGPSISDRLQPTRLTQDLSYAEFVRARAGRARVYVVWSGRSRVGKEIESANRSPEIFYTTLPLE